MSTMRERFKFRKKEKKKEGIGEIIRTVVYAVLIAVAIRTVAFEPFSIPSESMLPTLLVGDYLFVSKYAYGYSKHSLPFSPDVGDGRFLERGAERGDVVVFKLPRDNATDYIKRIIGLPGDRIQVRNGLLYVNGEQVKRERVEDFIAGDRSGTLYRVQRYRETLPNGVQYYTLDLVPNSDTDNTEEFVVPAGHYFMMGDNRDNSVDSRVPVRRGGVGYVPAENLVGRAEILFFSKEASAMPWEVWNWRFDRFLDTID
jgi:signal peptidase I